MQPWGTQALSLCFVSHIFCESTMYSMTLVSGGKCEAYMCTSATLLPHTAAVQACMTVPHITQSIPCPQMPVVASPRDSSGHHRGPFCFSSVCTTASVTSCSMRPCSPRIPTGNAGHEGSNSCSLLQFFLFSTCAAASAAFGLLHSVSSVNRHAKRVVLVTL